jgi:hypothetical protein
VRILTQLKEWISPGQSPLEGRAEIEQMPYRVIEFDMMLKGNLYERRKSTVRQCSVTVNGATRLVTSGDTVSKGVYDALVESGIILDDVETPDKPERDSTD